MTGATPAPPPSRHTRPIPKVQQAVDNTPTAKVTTATLAGALVTVLIFISAQAGFEIDGGTGAALATLLAFVGGYWKRSRPGDFDL